ncbi:MAG: hypothetical protein ACXIUM_00755 [Wenzhouxiangella sp.]
MFLLPALMLVLAALPRPLAAQSAQEWLFENLAARVSEKADILIHAEALEAFGVRGIHYQILSLSDADTCVGAQDRIVASDQAGSRGDDVCGVLGVYSLFSTQDIEVPLGVHRKARVILGPFGFFLLDSPVLEAPLVIHNELNPSLSPTDVLEAAAWSISRDPEDFRFLSLNLASAWHAFDPGFSVSEWREWVTQNSEAPLLEGLSLAGQEAECDSGSEGLDPELNSCFQCSLSCSSGGPGAMACGCGGGGAGWSWPPFFDWPPGPPPPLSPS